MVWLIVGVVLGLLLTYYLVPVLTQLTSLAKVLRELRSEVLELLRQGNSTLTIVVPTIVPTHSVRRYSVRRRGSLIALAYALTILLILLVLLIYVLARVQNLLTQLHSTAVKLLEVVQR